MKRLVLGVLALTLAPLAGATPITGNVSIAGVVESYTATQITFQSPAIVLPNSTGDFAPLALKPIDITPQIVFLTAAGNQFFVNATTDAVTMDILTLMVANNNSQFLNISGTADMIASGFTTTLYDYTLTATRPDGVSSFTMTAVPAPLTTVPEPASLLLVGTGLMFTGLLFYRKARKNRVPSHLLES